MIPTISSLSEYKEAYQKSVEHPTAFWAEIASTFHWRNEWEQVLEWEFDTPSIKWFDGGRLNITESCLDRHLSKYGNKTAYIFEPNDPGKPSVHISYIELYESVNRAANALKSLGVEKGDRVCIYLPMIPALPISVLACARIGAIHSVVFGGFSAKALADRIEDAGAKLLITADGAYRGDKIIPLKEIADEALRHVYTIENVLIVKQTNQATHLVEERDINWDEFMSIQSSECEAEEMEAENILFILYTSGSTGKPKGIAHSIGGYMVYTGYTFRNVFQYKENDVFWCTADIGWITGHSYLVYGPLLNGATSVLFEGTPTYPDPGRYWEIVDKHKVTHFYTAPTAIRMLEACDITFVKRSTLESLRVLGSVGEPINEEAWNWYHHHIGKGKCPIVDTWWQTETGGILISPLAGITELYPTYATQPLPGIQPAILDPQGREITEQEADGRLCIAFPWPSIARTIWGDHKRFKETYFSAHPGYYFTGDGCKRDKNGNYRITGRVDDVIIVSGHNLGTAEIENAIDEHPDVCETAVVGYPHPIKGNAIFAFAILNSGILKNEKTLREEIRDMVGSNIGSIAKPDSIVFVPGLPKTRSGKIMRRILRKIAEGDSSDFGDTSTLLDPDIVQKIVFEVTRLSQEK